MQKLIFFLIIFLKLQNDQCLATKMNDKDCASFKKKLKQDEVLYLECAMKFAVPVDFCIECHTFYTNVTESYIQLINAVHLDNKTNTTTICKEKYFDQDRLNIVQTLYDDMNLLWNKAFCPQCFDKNGSTAILTTQIKGEIESLNECLKDYKKDPCRNCLGKYVTVNQDYINYFEQKFNNEVCFDLQDAMNKTRYNWSKTLNCCKREINLQIFAVLSSILACLPISFYIFMFFYTKRIEQNHELLTDNYDTENNSTISQGISYNERDRENQPGTSTREAPEIYDNTKNEGKHKIPNSDSDYSDDDNAVIKNKKKILKKRKEKNLSSSESDDLEIKLQISEDANVPLIESSSNKLPKIRSNVNAENEKLIEL